VLVVDDKHLWATGLDYPTAVALMEPADGELIVHVTRISDDGGGSLRQTDRASSDVYQLVPTEEPPKSTGTRCLKTWGTRSWALSDEAKKRRLDLVCLGQGVYSLQGVMGQRFYSTLGASGRALRFNRW
jgi:hypothetical protein